VIEWLNANAGAEQGVATLVLVLLTARYVALTSRVARETRLNLRPSLSADVSVEPSGTTSTSRWPTRASDRPLTPPSV
jgi:hypothetical protein